MMVNRLQQAGTTAEIPRELLRSIPRNIVLSRAGKAAAGIAIALGISAVAAGVALYINAVRDAARHREMISQSAIGNGKVVRVGPRRDEGKRTVSYSFHLDGREYSGEATLQTRYWRTFPVGATVSVRYLPSEPQQNWLLGHEPEGLPFWTVAVVPLSLLLGPVIIVLTLRRERALLAEGRPALGRVTRLKRVHGRHVGGHGIGYGYTPGQRSGYRVQYEFSDLSGARHTGRANVVGIVPPEGSPIVIVYNPDEPQRSAPYPFQHVRIAAEF